MRGSTSEEGGGGGKEDVRLIRKLSYGRKGGKKSNDEWEKKEGG